MFMTRKIAFVILVLFLVTAAAAQGLPGQATPKLPLQSNISLKIANLGCTTSLGTNTFKVSAYSFGAVQDTSSIGSGGGAAGKATVQPLNATKRFDECSPALFGAVVTGKRFATADLVQEDEKGTPILTISLTDVLIGSFQIGGSESSATPQEAIQIDFRKICITEPSNNNKLCFDRATNTTN
jgi:type VI secretion system secreted protein Hcp